MYRNRISTEFRQEVEEPTGRSEYTWEGESRFFTQGRLFLEMILLDYIISAVVIYINSQSKTFYPTKTHTAVLMSHADGAPQLS